MCPTTAPMENAFLADISANPANRAILSRWQRLQLPDMWLVAGCLFQTVWNLQSGKSPAENIKDYDIFYFDAADLTKASEEHAQQHADAVLSDLGVTVEVANQARVHLWYPDHFGHPYGLTGLYEGTLTANPLVPHAHLFERKVASYRARWPWLTLVNSA